MGKQEAISFITRQKAVLLTGQGGFMKNSKLRKKREIIVNTGWRWKLVFTAVCLAAAVILQLCARKIAGFSVFYAGYVYPLWVNTVGRLMSLFPVSVSEILLYAGIVVLMLGIVKIVWFRKGHRAACIGSGLLSLLAAASFLFVIYTLNCGINYYNESFSKCEGFEIKERPVDELKVLCEKLTEQVNTYSSQVLRNKKGLCCLDNNVGGRAVEAMQAAGQIYPSLSGYYPYPKPLIVSQILSVQQLSGIYSPFTVEANYNRHMTAYNIPFTACHELSHLKGFMREDEANFIAWLACMASDHADFKYSGALLGWIYATNALCKVNPDMYNAVVAGLSDEVWADFKANTAFWDRYEGKIAEVSDKVNDTYLKANDQSDGVQSYSRMVDLMLAYYEKTEQ